jgi:hypothetical protein
MRPLIFSPMGPGIFVAPCVWSAFILNRLPCMLPGVTCHLLLPYPHSSLLNILVALDCCCAPLITVAELVYTVLDLHLMRCACLVSQTGCLSCAQNLVIRTIWQHHCCCIENVSSRQLSLLLLVSCGWVPWSFPWPFFRGSIYSGVFLPIARSVLYCAFFWT